MIGSFWRSGSKSTYASFIPEKTRCGEYFSPVTPASALASTPNCRSLSTPFRAALSVGAERHHCKGKNVTHPGKNRKHAFNGVSARGLDGARVSLHTSAAFPLRLVLFSFSLSEFET